MNVIMRVSFTCSIKNSNELYFIQGPTSSSICICSNQNTDYFFSISSDRYLYKWNNQTKLVEWSIKSPVEELFFFLENKHHIFIVQFSNYCLAQLYILIEI